MTGIDDPASGYKCGHLFPSEVAVGVGGRALKGGRL